MKYLIDPPSPFATKEEWQAFLDEMLAIQNKTPEIDEAIALAREAIANAEREE